MSDQREHWICTTCGRDVTIGDADCANEVMNLVSSTGRTDDEGIQVVARLIRCPSPSCKANDLKVTAHFGKPFLGRDGLFRIQPPQRPAGIGTFTFLPETPDPLSSDVPPSVKEDYRESYLIKDLSPKASATLARRALQGMIRDFYKVVAKTLHHELQAIKDRCDPELFEALMALKSIGNIGAHPDRDISLIVEIEPGEPQQLLDLIHQLDQEWYVERARRQTRLAAVRALKDQKSGPDAGQVGE